MSTERLRKDLWILDAAEQADAAEQYRQTCAHLFEITLLSPEDAFYNSLEGYNLGGVVFAQCKGVAQRFERRLPQIVGDGSDTIMLILDLDGSEWRGDYDGRAASSEHGAIRVVDMARPFSLTTTPYLTLYMILPRAQLDPQAAELDFHGLVVSERAGSGRLLATHLRTLWDTIEDMTSVDAAVGAKAAITLLGGAILSGCEFARDDARPVEKMLLATGRQYIEQRLADPDLAPEAVREHLGVSRSLVYKVFAPVGGISAFIQSRRLDQAFDAILQDRAEQQTLGEIAYRHGFRSDAHFSRAFSARFGVTPGRLRRVGESARKEGLSALERLDDVWAWVRSL
ncbi:helix-turn-helix domain-containing protein [Caulobacter sp.]|uniref:helix-turn-helix domain-containing protein n=1 Tax=Caulobacter sp. TaxID=78 RepID=UPI00160CE29B